MNLPGCGKSNALPSRAMVDAPTEQDGPRASHKICRVTVLGGFWDGLELDFESSYQVRRAK